MPPHVAFIVAGVVVGVGVAYVVGQHVYPEIKPHLDEFWRAFKEKANGRRRSEHPYSSMSSEDFDLPRNSTSSDVHEPKDMGDKSFGAREQESTGASTARSAWGEGLRQRPHAANVAAANNANEKLLDTDVEMVQLDRARSNVFPLMTPTSTRPSSRGPSPVALEDDNPFQEPSVPVAVAIPLPQSPTASLVVDPIGRSNPVLPRPQLPVAMPFNASSNESDDEHPLQTPIATSAPRLPSDSRRMSLPSQRPQFAHRSTGSISGVLSPPSLPAGETGTIRGLPPALARASSPSNASDHMSGSFVSAAPSRGWTDGGTADIFSGSERESGYHDSDEDGVRSASDSDEWEEIDSSRGANPPASGTNTHSGRN